MVKKYEEYPLKQALLRVDFQNPLAGYENGVCPAVEQAMQETFPGKMEQATQQDMWVWAYFSKDGKKRAQIEPTAFYIKYNNTCNNHETLIKDFSLVFNAIIKHYQDLDITRIGLRYVDEMEIRESDFFGWKEYLSPELYSILSLPDNNDQQYISRALSVLEFNYGDHNLILKYGRHNPDYPSPIRRKVFLLDSDAYKQDAIPESDVLSTIEQLHSCVDNLLNKRVLISEPWEAMYGKG